MFFCTLPQREIQNVVSMYCIRGTCNYKMFMHTHAVMILTVTVDVSMVCIQEMMVMNNNRKKKARVSSWLMTFSSQFFSLLSFFEFFLYIFIMYTNLNNDIYEKLKMEDKKQILCSNIVASTRATNTA